ncbi:hypothetical protein BH10PSE16_BH10PSE16_42150 [soil metagenome]
MKHTVMALATGLVMAVTMAGCAQPYGENPEMMAAGGPAGWHGAHGRGMGMGMGRGMMWDDPDLGLTPEQRAGIAGVQAEFRRKQSALMEKMHEEGGRSAALEGGLFDEPAARKAYEAMAELQRQMFENSLDERRQIDSLLTPQQREQIQIRMRQMQQMRNG